MKKIFMSDIDGVLANFDDCFSEYAKRKIPNLPAPDLSQYDFKKRYPSIEAEIEQVWQDFIKDDHFSEIKPYPGAQKVSYFEPVIITARPESSRAATASWLSKHGFYYKDLILEYDKKKYADPQMLRAYFEDRPDYLQQFANAGVPTFKRVHPYNAGITGKNIIPFTSWNLIPVKYILTRFPE